MSDTPDKNTHLPDMPEDDSQFLILEDAQLSEEDRQEIFEEIEKVVEANRIPVTDSLFSIKPQKKGSLFPVLLNLVTLALIAGGVFFAFRFFQSKQDTLSLETQQYLSTEGKLIEEIRKESRQKLEQKEEEINRIQSELEDLDRQSRELANTMEENIRAREEELRRELEAELEAERERLRAQGISTEEIEEQVTALETERRAQFDQQLAEFRQESRAELEQKEQELVEARALAQQILEEANSERAELEQDLARRESELRAQFESEREALESRSSEAEARLRELSEIRERESLINDQIIGSYADIIEKIQLNNFDQAESGLEELRNFIQTPSLQSLPSISKRRGVELFIIDTLEENLSKESASAEADTSSLLENANLVVAARELVQRADTAANQGDRETARTLYTQALGVVPALNRAYRNIRTIEETQSSGAIRELVITGQQQLQEGRRGDALNSFRQAALLSAGMNQDMAEDAIDGLQLIYERQRRLEVADREQIIADRNAVILRNEDLLNERREELEELQQVLEGVRDELAGKEEESEQRAAVIEERDETIARLEGERNRLREEIDALTLSLEDEGSAVSELTGRIDDLSSEIETLTEELEAREEEVTTLTSDNNDLNEEISRLQTRIDELEQESSALAGRGELTDDEINELREELARKDDEIERLARGNSDVAELNRTIGDQADEISELEAELARVTEERDEARDRVDPERIARLTDAAREEAMEDVLDAAALYTGSAETDRRRRVEALANSDMMYAGVVDKLREIAERDPEEVEVLKVKEIKMIGTVASVTAGRIMIEPLTAVSLDDGTPIIIKRKISTGEIPIAEGSVYNSSAGRISARIETRLSATRNPMVMDLIYAEVEE